MTHHLTGYGLLCYILHHPRFGECTRQGRICPRFWAVGSQAFLAALPALRQSRAAARAAFPSNYHHCPRKATHPAQDRLGMPLPFPAPNNPERIREDTP
jgi:hypothetical protein